MRTLLVLAEHPDFAEAVRASLNAEQYRVVHRTNVEEAEPLLVHGVADACILDLELSQVQGLWSLEKLRRRAPRCPVIIYAGAQPWEWEEEAYLQGSTHVLAKPVRPRLLAGLLERLWVSPATAPVPAPLPLPALPSPQTTSPGERSTGPPRHKRHGSHGSHEPRRHERKEHYRPRGKKRKAR